MKPCYLIPALLAMISFAPIDAAAQAGRGCSVFNQCPGGYSCMPFRQVCHRDSGALANEACQAGYGCAAGFNCEAGSQVCRGPGRQGDSCHATRPCGSGLTCEAGSHVCRAPGAVGDSCHATRPCGSGLSCEAGSHVCRAPGAVGDACHVTRPCGSGLSCQPGVHQCYHEPRKAGEPCVAGFGCGDGLYCQSFLQKCVAKSVDYNSNSACGALRVQATAEDARRANITMSFSAGSSGGAGAYASYETGVVYGNQGQFGCFAQACIGNQSNVSLGNFANFGIYNRYEDFIGFSALTGQSVDTPFVKFGFQTSQVFSAQAPPSPGQILKNRFVGTTSGLSFGVGLSPVTVGSALCYTARLDAGNPLRDFANIENLLKGWGQLGYASAKRPVELGGSDDTRPLPLPPTQIAHGFDSNRHYRLTTAFRGPGMSLDIYNGGARNDMAHLAPTGNYSGQLWTIAPRNAEWFELRTAFRGDQMCLDLYNGGDRHFMPHLAPCADVSRQLWKIVALGNGQNRIQNMFGGEGRCLDIFNGGAYDNLPHLTDCAGYSGQFWSVEPVQ